MKKKNVPYQNLGKELAKIRSRFQESVAEVSGAVEIDSDRLISFENGEDRPSEDILELLISHFSIKDDEATRLYKLAGYEDAKSGFENDEAQLVQQPVVVLPFDARIIYTDAMNVSIDKHGVVINFLQGAHNQQIPAARLGMSLDYAKKVADTLQETIRQATTPRNLPAPNENEKNQDN